jgi:hypothetical protein
MSVELRTGVPERVMARFGNAVDNGFGSRGYSSDMTDAEWAVVRPLLPVPGWMRGQAG